jgi:hypothetical protein
VKREAANVQIFKRARRVKERVYERYFLQRRCKSRIDSKSKGPMERCLTRVTAEGWVSTLLWQYQAWESRSLRALSSELSRRTVFSFSQRQSGSSSLVGAEIIDQDDRKLENVWV